MLNIRDLTLFLKRENRPIVEHFSLGVMPKQKIAFVGEEGNGKSSILKAIVDFSLVEEYLDVSGSVQKHGEVLGYLPQIFDVPCLERSVKDILEERMNAYFDYALFYELLASLDLDASFVDSEVLFRDLSGGEKIKFGLLLELLKDPTVLLLDEPTNDLDLATIEWLEGFLVELSIPVLLVSHDEQLVEAVADTIVHIEQLEERTKPRVTVARKKYSEYFAERARVFDHQDQVAKKEQAEHRAKVERHQQIYERVKHEQNTISRRDPAGGRLLKKKMKTVIAQRKRYEKEEKDLTQKAQREDTVFMKFSRAMEVHAGARILDLSLPELRAGERLLSKDIRLTVIGPKKIVIVGKNGSGKTTLLLEVLKALKQKGIRYGYMPQNYMNIVCESRDAIDFLRAEGVGDVAEYSEICTFLGSMNFTYDEMRRHPNQLSGGQRAKLYLTQMMRDEAEVLVLDEPTRNLSPFSSAELRSTLKEYRGAVIAVSHDRVFIEDVFDEVYELSDKGFTQIV